jgi:hypothetical protein
VARTLVANKLLAGSACGKRQRGRPLNSLVRRHVETVVAFILFAGLSSVAASTGSESKDALLEFYPQATVLGKSVEVCFTNDCEFYESRTPLNKSAWDAVFLHQYFFVAPKYREEFRAKYSAHADAVLERRGSLCSASTSEKRPACLVESLAKQAGLRYATVKYDEGQRCQAAGRLTSPKSRGRTVCRKDRHAS